MRIIETTLPGVLLIEPQVFEDARGFFFESYHEQRYHEAGITNRFVQDNHSRSARGTLRGLHYQLQHPQAKLCRVVQGEVFDVVADIRHGSPTFGQWTSTYLSAQNKRQIFIPAGFAHGFLVITETAEFLYKCDDFYHPGDEYGIAWNDPNLNINWETEPLKIDFLLSVKDQQNRYLQDVPVHELPQWAGTVLPNDT